MTETLPISTNASPSFDSVNQQSDAKLEPLNDEQQSEDEQLDYEQSYDSDYQDDDYSYEQAQYEQEQYDLNYEVWKYGDN